MQTMAELDRTSEWNVSRRHIEAQNAPRFVAMYFRGWWLRRKVSAMHTNLRATSFRDELRPDYSGGDPTFGSAKKCRV
jgi:hypothetical protein